MSLNRVVKMAVSDANKTQMLEFPGVVDLLIKAALLDSPMEEQKGVRAMQEAAIELLLQLALFKPWMRALQKHGGDSFLQKLRSLLMDKAATPGAVRSAKQTLFQLEPQSFENDAGDDGCKAAGSDVTTTKHLMLSYCWAQQSVIKRIHAALTKKGYRVWIDIEDMRGSTVDSMAAAVEGACFVLIGVSREYKESTNCRMEAQYAMQRDIPTVPLLLEEGYRADGWLGMLLGSRLWYGFFGTVISEASAFEGKVSELCREIGDRGRAATCVVAETKGQPPAPVGRSGMRPQNKNRTRNRKKR